jgi:hypothetical protein
MAVVVVVETETANLVSAGSCTCSKAADGGYNPVEHEIDFTTKK